MKKHNHNKKIAPIVFTLVLLGFFLYDPTTTPEFTPKKQTVSKHGETKIAPNKATQKKEVKRNIASLPTTKPVPKIDGRELIGNIHGPKNLRYTNTINKDWKEIYSHTFKRMAQGEEVKDFKVESKRSVIKIKNNVGTYMEHVKVSFTRPQGGNFSFEALINSETGSIVQTWNKTRYEFKQPIKVNGSKYAFKNED